jgi:hypothetical protein
MIFIVMMMMMIIIIIITIFNKDINTLMSLGSSLRTSGVSEVTFRIFLHVFRFLPQKELDVGISICKYILIGICGFCSCFSLGFYFLHSIPF